MRTAATLAALLALAAPAAAQPGVPRALQPADFEVFLGVLQSHKFQPMRIWGMPAPVPQVLIVLRPPPRVANPFVWPPPPPGPDLSRRVLAAGGSVLIAADGGADLSGYFPAPTRVRTVGGRLAAPPDQSWDGNPRCPLADPVAHQFAGAFNLPRVATNAPATLDVRRTGPYLGKILARLPRGTTDELTGAEPDDLTLAAGGVGPSGGQALVVADPDVFSNQMMTAVDAAGRPTDNLALSDALARLLANGNTAPTCLVLVDGQVRMAFDAVDLDRPPPIPPVPLPSLDPFDPRTAALDRALTTTAEDAVAAAEARDGGLDRLLGGNERSGGQFARTVRMVLAPLLLFAALFVLRRVWRARHRPNADEVPPAPEAVRADPTGPVRDYVRELFRQAGAGDFAGKMPAVDGPRAKTFRPGLRILWGVAADDDARPVTPARWRELAPHLQAAQDGLTAGHWRFRLQTSTR